MSKESVLTKYLPVIFDANFSMKEKEDFIKNAMEEYAKHVLKKELEEMTDEVIEKKFPIGLTMTTNAHYRARHKRLGAKWLRDQILSKTK